MSALIPKVMGGGMSAGLAANLLADVQNSMTAAGTSQSDAQKIGAATSRFTTVASGSGAILPAGAIGDECLVINAGANALSLYPPSGHAINAGSTNAAISVASTGSLIVKRVTNTLWIAQDASQLLFLQSGTGATSRTVQNRLRDAIHVTDFLPEGYVTDGSVDYTTQITSAITAASGKALAFPNFTLLITSGLTVPANDSSYIGTGKHSKILCNTGSTDNGINMLKAISLSGIVVENIYFQNSGFGDTTPVASYAGAGVGVLFVNCTDSIVRDCFFNKCGDNGQGVSSVYFSSCQRCIAQGNVITDGLNGVNSDSFYRNTDSTSRSKRNLITGNQIYSVKGYPIVVDIEDTEGTAEDVGDDVIGNVLYDNKYGIAVIGQKCNIVGNHIDMNNKSVATVGWDAITVTGIDNVVADNFIINPYRSGIFAYARGAGTLTDYQLGGSQCKGIRIEGNTVKWDSDVGAGHSTSHGIYVDNQSIAGAVDRVQIINNNVMQYRQAGIRVAGDTGSVGFGDLQILGNHVRGNSGASAPTSYGIEVNTSATTSAVDVSGNVVVLAGLSGIYLSAANRATVKGNTCRSNKQHGILISASQRCTVQGNVCTDNGQQTVNTYDGIQMTAVCNVSALIGNSTGNVGGAQQRYGINLNDSGGGRYIVIGNVYGSHATGSINDGTGIGCTILGEGIAGQQINWLSAAPTADSWNAGDLVFNTAPAAGAYRSWTNISAGSPGTWAGNSGIPLVNNTAVGNVGAGEDDLCTVTLPASTLINTSSGIRITAWGTGANNANAKTLKVYFGTQVILTTSLTANQVDTWRVTATVWRTGSSTQDWESQLLQAGTASLIDVENGTATQTESGTIAIKCTGEATSNNDIVNEGLIVELLR